MIITAIFGGLGNQMFQYACGRALALRTGNEMKLDLRLVKDRTPREGFTYRDYELNYFNIQSKIATNSESRRFAPNLWAETPCLYKKMFEIKRKLLNRQLFEETDSFYNKNIEQITDEAYLYGYFQSEKYFKDYAADIRKEFVLKSSLSVSGLKIFDKIHKTDCSCSIHVRRGDFLQNEIHNVCTTQYFKDAIQKMTSLFDGKISFFCFSDDIEWIKVNIRPLAENMIIVEHDSSRPNIEDMILMSKCSHHIIPNSSFSWWGAWLNPSEEKKVIAPKRWSATNVDIQMDIVPEKWITQ